MNGFLNILKPPGMTSAAVVAVVKRLTGEQRVGHAGTLDPEAAGVLPVMIGRAARLFDFLVDKEKAYVAECAFGFATDTQDATGVIVATGENYPTYEDVAAAAKQLEGEGKGRLALTARLMELCGELTPLRPAWQELLAQRKDELWKLKKTYADACAKRQPRINYKNGINRSIQATF